MMINCASIVNRFEKNVDSFRSLLAVDSPEQIQWRPTPEKWSIIEVVNHLYDEEREDFKCRLRLILENPNKVWPSIAPQQWVVERGYSKRNYEASVSSFLNERKRSIKWLQDLESPNWKASYNHPQIGTMTAEMILVNWLAHDYLHIRQIVGLKYGYLAQNIKPISLDYAGRWS